jgi:hypothetical protein
MTQQNDDDFNFDEDLFGPGDRGGADDALNFDDDPLGTFGDGDDFSFDDDLESEPRSNRTFVVLAVLIIFLFLIGVAGVLFFALRNTGPSPQDVTRTAIANINATQQLLLNATQTQSAENAAATGTQVVIDSTTTAVALVQQTLQAQAFATQMALEATQTALAQPTATPTPSLTPTLSDEDIAATQAAAITDLPPAAQFTAQAETAIAQATFDAGTQIAATLSAAQTEAALNPPTATGIVGPGGLRPEDVLLTATALSQTLSPQTPLATTPEIGGTAFVVATARPDRLPDTGLFDDISGSNSFGVLALMAVGLIGVIAAARRMRK